MRRAIARLAAVLILGGGIAGAWPAFAADVPAATPQQLSALTEILARSEFQVAGGRSALDQLLDPVRTWVRWLNLEIQRLLEALLDPITRAGGAPTLYVIVGVGLIVVVIAAIMLRRLLRGSLAVDAALTHPHVGGPPRAADELARARSAAQAGDPRRAVHHQYRAVLLRLDERDHLPFDGTLTNRELLPRLTTAPALAEPFAALVERFDRLWYGQTACSAEEYAAFAELGERVWQSAESVLPARSARHGPASPAGALGAASGAR